jgi:Cellulase (glycosyl hydrolase family 5)
MNPTCKQTLCLGFVLLFASIAQGQRIGNGINLDVAHPTGFPKVKIGYDAAQLDAIKAAGFKSIRFFITTADDSETYKPRIDDALHRGLTVVICLWGDGQWAEEPDEGVAEFAAVWDKIANCFKDYPSDLVFELLNEPAALVVKPESTLGLKDGKTVMAYLNAAIPVIRQTNPQRILAIGGPGFNGAAELRQFVTPEHLTYKLSDGTGFANDANVVGVFHMYHPHNFTHWTAGLDEVPKWKEEVTELFSHAAAWSKKWDKPVLLSEWGAWSPPKHTACDFKQYLQFVVKQCENHEIAGMYYTAGFNDEWAFNILHSKKGWNQDALNLLTGATALQARPKKSAVPSNAKFRRQGVTIPCSSYTNQDDLR